MQGWAEGKWTKEPVCYCAGPDPLWWKRWVPSRKHGSARDEVEDGVRILMCVCWWQFRTWDTRAYDSAITDLILILGFLTSEVYFRGPVRVHNLCSGTTIFMVCLEIYRHMQRGKEVFVTLQCSWMAEILSLKSMFPWNISNKFRKLPA